MKAHQIDPLQAGALREICLESCPHVCGTCFHILTGGRCAVDAAPSRSTCDYWVLSFHDFLRAFKRWQQLHPGQLPEERRQTGPRRYALERDRGSCEGFFPACCRTCKHRRPGGACHDADGEPCPQWEISLPFYLMGSHLWRKWHPWPEY